MTGWIKIGSVEHLPQCRIHYQYDKYRSPAFPVMTRNCNVWKRGFLINDRSNSNLPVYWWKIDGQNEYYIPEVTQYFLLPDAE